MKINTSNNRKWKVYHCNYSERKVEILTIDILNVVKDSKYIHLDKLELLVWEEVKHMKQLSDKESFKNSVLPQRLKKEIYQNRKLKIIEII